MKNEQVIDHIVDWLKTYCENAGLNGFVVGVSGGVDSALTSTLCAHTGFKTIVLNMPIYQAADQVSRADNHIEWLKNQFENVEGREVDLTPPFKALENHLPEDIQDPLTMANTRARVRMLTLYAHAAHFKMLVAGTGNKVEDFGVGFFTKYGDGGVDLSPIADLLKSEVFALAETLGVNQEILDAAPTDGLWEDNRSDEDQIGATYPELEWAMNFIDKQGNEDELTERQKEVINIYLKFHMMNKHKMVPIPVCEIPLELK